MIATHTHTTHAPDTLSTNDRKIATREDLYRAHFEMSRDEYHEACRRALLAGMQDSRF